MARKSLKQKEAEYLAKTKGGDSPITPFIPIKSEREKAFELLEKKGFDVSYKDNVLYCNCRNKAQFEEYKAYLLEHFSRDGKVAFSFGATIGKEN